MLKLQGLHLVPMGKLLLLKSGAGNLVPNERNKHFLQPNANFLLESFNSVDSQFVFYMLNIL